MKLTLTNFKCYENKIFTFRDSGITLLSGRSGMGKSTILQAIYFALYGSGGSSVVSYGKSSCEVVLEFKDLVIKRSKRPNRLVVNGVHEDEAAQKIINDLYSEDFLTTGYISQTMVNSFLVMSPVGKLEFLEKFIFSSTDIATLKSRCSDLIKKDKEALNLAITQHSFSLELLKASTLPPEVIFPLRVSLKNRERAMKNEDIKSKNCQTLIKRARRKMKKINKEKNANCVLTSQVQLKSEQQSDLEKQKERIMIELNKDLVISPELEHKKRKLSLLLKNRKLKSLVEKLKKDKKLLETMKKGYIDDLQERRKQISKDLWTEYDNENETRELLEEYTCTLDDLINIRKLKEQQPRLCENFDLDAKTTEIKKLKLEYQQLYNKWQLQKNVYKCPSCKSHLKLRNQVLELVSEEKKDFKQENVNQILKTMEQKLEHEQYVFSQERDKRIKFDDLQKKINLILDNYEDHDDLPLEGVIKEGKLKLEKYIREQERLDSELSLIKKKIKDVELNQRYDSRSINMFIPSIKQDEKRILDLKNCDDDEDDDDGEEDEEELRSFISLQENKIKRERDLRKSLMGLSQKILLLENQITVIKQEYVKDYGTLRSLEELDLELEACETSLKELEEQLQVHSDNLIRIEKYKDYSERLEQYQNLEKKVSGFQEKVDENTKKLAASNLLKSHIIKAESLAIANMVESINSHARVYIDSFFQDEPLSANLMTFKETKKAIKPQINISIQHKGIESDIRMLSGGEFSRLTLAFTLALNEIFNIPILLLDESTASLDQETTTDVFETIEEHMPDKLCLVVAHNIIQGHFDNVIRI